MIDLMKAGVSPEPSPGAGAAPAVEAIGVTKRFGATVALDDVQICVRQGEAHALVGRNGAGKSTLVSILTGLQGADAGTVRFGGRPAPALSDRHAWRQVAACVYQKSTIIPSLSIAENLFLNRQHTRGPVVSWKSVRAAAQQLLDEWDVPVDAVRRADVLTVEQRQMVEIARAMSFGARFLILDEPTAQLDARGIERLYERLRGLQRRGVSYLYISHHLQEIFDLCQTVTVFRDARHIVTAPVAELSHDDLVAAMTGEAKIEEAVDQPSTVQQGAAPVLEVRDLTAPGSFESVELVIAPGEVIGITGGGSSGRVALAETIVGLRRAASGTVLVHGERLRSGSVPAALDAGIGFVPRDRHHEGLVEGLSVGENITMPIPRRLGRFGFLSPRRRDQLARSAIRNLGIVASGPEQQAGSLSGGNQQKVVMARALANEPRVLVLMHPTAGVDVRSKAALLEVVQAVREHGTAVVIVSDELDDLRPCDRVIVMLHGRVSRELARGWKDNELVAATEGFEVNA
jgi:simple sugar transport system ATP-binding protein